MKGSTVKKIFSQGFLKQKYLQMKIDLKYCSSSGKFSALTVECSEEFMLKVEGNIHLQHKLLINDKSDAKVQNK